MRGLFINSPPPPVRYTNVRKSAMPSGSSYLQCCN